MKDFLSNKYFSDWIKDYYRSDFIYASVGKLFNAEAFAKASRLRHASVVTLNILAIILLMLSFHWGFSRTGIYKKGSSAIAILSLVMFPDCINLGICKGTGYKLRLFFPLKQQLQKAIFNENF